MISEGFAEKLQTLNFIYFTHDIYVYKHKNNLAKVKFHDEYGSTGT